MREYSSTFIRFNWLSLVFIYLVIIAGSFVRVTGSGMGCPDWPKCFGNWVPPTDINQLPDNYKDIYSSKRAKKIDKFANLLEKTGFVEAANGIRSDKTLLLEQEFNPQKTWTEYVNRLFGFLAGNAILIVFLWILWKYRTRKLVVLSFINLLILGFQAWFGSIVVATNLVPWTITVHMLLALVIIGLQLLIIRKVDSNQRQNLIGTQAMWWLIFVCFSITFVQMFLGTQVREAIDELTKAGLTRSEWTDSLGLPFLIHRSFSWLVLILLLYLGWINRKEYQFKLINYALLILFLELFSGVLLAYASMPGLVQISHLVFATLLFGVLGMALLRLKFNNLNQ
jgi:heme a synthase